MADGEMFQKQRLVDITKIGNLQRVNQALYHHFKVKIQMFIIPTTTL